MTEAICINCGSSNVSIYKQFSKDIIKLTTCESCGDVVDKYAEIELSIIIIDMLLLKKAALRHVLFNSNFQGVWKAIVLFILCDAYEKTSHKYLSKPSLKHGEYVIDLELNFYLLCIKSLLEYFIFAMIVVMILYQSPIKNAPRFSFKYFLHGIVLARYGKLFMLPLLVWSKSDNYCEVLIVIFIFLSQIQVIRVTTELSSVAFATVLILISELVFWTLRNSL